MNISEKTGRKEKGVVDIKYLKVADLLPNPYQPESRVNVDQETAKKFALSFQEHGLIQTPVVRAINDHFEIADGWLRRTGFLFNFKEFGLKEYETMPCVVRELTDQQMADMVMEANTIRKDLNPIELAKFYRRYLEDFKIPQVELARKHNCTQGEIANTIRLLELPENIQGKIISQEISETHGRQLLRLNYNPELQQEVFAEIIRKQPSVNELSNDIGSKIWWNSESLDPSNFNGPKFDTKECEQCPSRQKIGYPFSSDKKKWRCLNKKCFERKSSEAEQAQLVKLQAEIKQAHETADKGKGKGKKGEVGIIDCSKLTWRDYQELDCEYHKIDNPEQCKKCVNRTVGRFYSGNTGPICINVKCFKEKERAYEAKVAAQAREEGRKLTEQIKAICANVADETAFLKVLGKYLVGHSRKDTRQKFARMYDHTIDDCFSLLTAGNKADILTKVAAFVLQLERYEGEEGRFRRMLADLDGTGDEIDKQIAEFREKHCKTCRHDKDEGGCNTLIKVYYRDKCYAYWKASKLEQQ